MAKNSEKASNSIRDFFNVIKPHVKHEFCVIDFAIVNDTVYVLEINPFNAGTGTGLFSWKNSKDRNIMLHGPFEFRFRKSIPENVQSVMLPDWSQFADSILSPSPQ